jgi:hypothetical protein
MEFLQTDELTFENKLYKVDDFQMNLAQRIMDVLNQVKEENRGDKQFPPSTFGIIASDGGVKLNLAYMLERNLNDVAQKYRITIEKINTDV